MISTMENNGTLTFLFKIDFFKLFGLVLQKR